MLLAFIEGLGVALNSWVAEQQRKVQFEQGQGLFGERAEGAPAPIGTPRPTDVDCSPLATSPPRARAVSIAPPPAEVTAPSAYDADTGAFLRACSPASTRLAPGAGPRAPRCPTPRRATLLTCAAASAASSQHRPRAVTQHADAEEEEDELLEDNHEDWGGSTHPALR